MSEARKDYAKRTGLEVDVFFLTISIDTTFS